jgi:hypothetical protein
MLTKFRYQVCKDVLLVERFNEESRGDDYYGWGHKFS